MSGPLPPQYSQTRPDRHRNSSFPCVHLSSLSPPPGSTSLQHSALHQPVAAVSRLPAHSRFHGVPAIQDCGVAMATRRLDQLLPFLLLLLLTSQEALCQECSTRCHCANSRVDCSNSNLTWGPRPLPPDTRILNLENNDLKMIFPRTLEPLPDLEELRLTGNKIRAIRSQALAGFPKLLKLDASRNQIQNVHRQGLAGLAELKTLSFSNNNLRHVARIFLVTPALQQVNLAFNNIRYLTNKDFQATPRINYLDLRNNALRNINARAFSRLGSLRYLLLNHNPLSSLPALAFPANSVLQILDLNHCRLQAVPQGLPASLTDLRLGHNRLDSLGATDLQRLPRLRLAALNDNNIASIHPESFSGLPQLAEVWLRSNKLREIPQGLPATVRKLFLDSNLVSELPSQAFGPDSRLQQLTMQGNRLQRISSTALQGLQHLQSVSFQGNMIQQLSPGTFSSLPNLASLVLSNNPLGDVQPGAFRDLPALRELSLSYAESPGGGDSAVHMEAALLGEMPALTRLDMMNSLRLTSALLQSLARSPPSPHPSLQELDLSYNDLATLPPEVKDVFPHLTRLNLEGNPWLCDHGLLWLKHWMLEGSVSFFVTDPPTCEEPFNLKGREIIQVPDDQFAEVRVIAQDFQQPPAQNAGGLTEELAPLAGQEPEVAENTEGQTDQPLLSDQGRLYQPIGGQMYQRPQEILSNSTSREDGRTHGSVQAGDVKALPVGNDARSFKAARPDQGSVAMGNARSDLTILQANHHHHLETHEKTAPDASQLSDNDVKTPVENSASSKALAIKRPDHEAGRETESETAKEGSLTAQEDPSGAKDVQVEQNSVARTTPQRATPPQPNAVKKLRGQKGRRRRGRGRGRKKARKGKGGTGRKNRRQRRKRRRRHHGRRGQRRSRANPVSPTGVTSDAGLRASIA